MGLCVSLLDWRAGLAGGVSAEVSLNLLRGRASILVARTRELTSARAQLLEIEAQLRLPGGAASAQLAEQYSILTAQVRRLEDQIATIRALGGQALRDAEATLATRTRELAELELQANAYGQSPSAAAATRNSAAHQAARNALREAESALAAQYNAVERRRCAVFQAHLVPQVASGV